MRVYQQLKFCEFWQIVQPSSQLEVAPVLKPIILIHFKKINDSLREHASCKARKNNVEKVFCPETGRATSYVTKNSFREDFEL